MKPTNRTFFAVALAGMLTAAPLMAHEPGGASSRSIIREAARLAGEATAQDDAAWLHVRRLPAGTKIVVSIRGAAPRERRFVSGDDAQLTVEISGGARESIARGDVVEIKTAPMGWDSHNKAVLAAIGGGVGALAGYFLAYDYPRGEKGIYRGAYVGVPLGLGAGVATGLVIAGKYQQTIYRSGR